MHVVNSTSATTKINEFHCHSFKMRRATQINLSPSLTNRFKMFLNEYDKTPVSEKTSKRSEKREYRKSTAQLPCDNLGEDTGLVNRKPMAEPKEDCRRPN